jgi:hypothetical protein
MASPDRWESGSEFSWLSAHLVPRADPAPWDQAGQLLFSGRDALRMVLRTGVARHGWRRLWVPEYFCQHVVAALVRPDLELLPYLDHPLRTTVELPPARPQDAVLVINYFGLRAPWQAPEGADFQIVEDHSHDLTSPWAWTSRADYCIASLRKTLPLSDGGVVWSPRGHPLPAAPAMDEQRRRAAGLKLGAMLLKAMYLDGLPVDKAGYRELARLGEVGLARPSVSSISEVSRAVVDAFDLKPWRDLRRRNVEFLRTQLKGVRGLRLPGPHHPDAVAFSGLVVVDEPQRRDRLVQGLFQARIYPAVLWLLEETVLPVGDEARDLSRRTLSIHGDGRYDLSDIARITAVVRGAG